MLGQSVNLTDFISQPTPPKTNNFIPADFTFEGDIRYRWESYFSWKLIITTFSVQDQTIKIYDVGNSLVGGKIVIFNHVRIYSVQECYYISLI